MTNFSGRIPKVQKSEEVAAKIRKFIIDNALRPGDRLPTEAYMAQQFGVSRVSVREATKALGFLGIINAAPRRGLTVGQVNVSRFSRYLSFHFAMGEYSNDELRVTRKIVEIGCLESIAHQMANDADVYKCLNGQNEKMRDLNGTLSVADWIACDIEFHCQLIAASRLRFMMAFNDLIQVFFERLRSQVSPGHRADSVSDHQGVIDALREGDVETARTKLTTHIDRSAGTEEYSVT